MIIPPNIVIEYNFHCITTTLLDKSQHYSNKKYKNTVAVPLTYLYQPSSIATLVGDDGREEFVDERDALVSA